MSKMCSFEDAISFMDGLGLRRQVRADDIKGHYRQFNENSSSIHIHEKRSDCILYATDTDFSKIRGELTSRDMPFLLIEDGNKESISAKVKENKRAETDKFILIRNGNRILHSPSESALKHEVICYTDENFRVLAEILAMNEYNLKLGKK